MVLEWEKIVIRFKIRNNILYVEVVIVQYSSFVGKINIAYVGHSSTIWVHPSHHN